MLHELNAIIEAAPKRTRLFKAASAAGVRHTGELDRIMALPRRVYTETEAERITDQMTELLRLPGSNERLRPVQAISLLELAQYGGLVGPQRAGAGKTLTLFLAPYVLNAHRPVILMPAKLIKSKQAELIEYAKNWRVAYWLHFLSYESLSRISKETFLRDLQCDFLGADEAHKLKNRKAACTKRVKEYLEINVDCPFVPKSGTLTKRSVQDYAHLSKWALRDGSPVPIPWEIVEEWGNAIDERPRSTFRTPPGALTVFSEGGSDDLTKIREGFQRRVNETPGVVATFDKLTDCSLIINRLQLDPDKAVEEAFQLLRLKKETPDGWRLMGGLDVARHARSLPLGFFQRWNPRAPKEWLEKRTAWAEVVSHDLAYNRSKRYSELQVALACSKGLLDEDACKVYREWVEIRKTFKPKSEAVWISDKALRVCGEWLKNKDEPAGIVWTEHVPFAEKLAELTGVPYCGEGGEDSKGKPIEAYKGQPIIASVKSSGEGRNLQDGWCRSLVTCPASLGATWEQLLARLHRDGQLEDEVTFDVLSACFEYESAFAQARLDAVYIRDTTKQDQRLLYADVLWDAPKGIGPVWTRVATAEKKETK
jgi:hypothetical protein